MIEQDQMEKAVHHFFKIFNVDIQSLQEWERQQVCKSIKDALKVCVDPENEELVMRTLEALEQTVKTADTRAEIVRGVAHRMGNRERARRGLSIVAVILDDIHFTDSLMDHAIFGILA